MEDPTLALSRGPADPRTERVEITVRGSHAAYRRPERGTVHATVGLEGQDAAAVHDGTARSAQALAESLRALHNPSNGPVTWWASDQLRTWAHRPWNKDGKQLPLVHHAQVDLQAKFSDFDALGQWLTRSLAVAGVTVQRIEWTLTEVRQREMVAEVRAAAVRDARERAQAYADALELGPVEVAAVADAGMLGQGLMPTGPEGPESFVRAAALDAGGGLAFTPQDVAVTAQVDAVFVAPERS